MARPLGPEAPELVFAHPKKGLELIFGKRNASEAFSGRKLEACLTNWASNSDRADFPKVKKIRFNKCIKLKVNYITSE